MLQETPLQQPAHMYAHMSGDVCRANRQRETKGSGWSDQSNGEINNRFYPVTVRIGK